LFSWDKFISSFNSPLTDFILTLSVCLSLPPISLSLSLFVILGIETRSHHVKQACYHLSYASALLYLLFAFETGCHCYLCQHWYWIGDTPPSASWVARIIVMWQHTWLNIASSLIHTLNLLHILESNLIHKKINLNTIVLGRAIK
jgi:hypothetical protein